jgi:hypothetical protein
VRVNRYLIRRGCRRLPCRTVSTSMASFLSTTR